MENQNTLVENKPKEFSAVLEEKLDAVYDALPVDFNKVRFISNCVALMNESSAGLAQFSKQYGTGQIMSGMVRGAFLGLDALNREFHLVPFGNKLNFMIGYRGAQKLAKKYSMRPVRDIYAKLIRQGDVFEEEIIHGVPTINFKPKTLNTGAIIGAFAVCLFEDGGMIYDTMTLPELEKTRNASRSKNSPAWSNYTGEMYKKTVINRLCKHIEIDFESQDQRKIFFEDSKIEVEKEEIEVPDLFPDMDDDIVESEVVDEIIVEDQE